MISPVTHPEEMGKILNSIYKSKEMAYEDLEELGGHTEFNLKEGIARGFLISEKKGENIIYRLSENGVEIIEDSIRKSKSTFAQINNVEDFDDLPDDKKKEYYSLNEL